MIARIAPRAIWRPKLAETFFTPNASACTAFARFAWSPCTSLVVSDSVRTVKLRYASPPVEVPRPWICALASPIRAA